MLEGLEATEVRISEIENNFTIGSEFYSKANVALIEKIKGCNYPVKKLSSICSLITDGDHSAPDYKERGILYLLSESIQAGYINKTIYRYISQSLHNTLAKSALQANDVLVTKTGIYFGKSAVVPEGFPEANTSAHVGIMRLSDDTINPYYLSTFINSKFGYQQFRRRGIKATRPEIKLVEFNDISIVQLPKSLQIDVENLVKQSAELRKAAEDGYTSAESYLLECLGMQDFVANPDAYNIKTLKESLLESGRIDAEYYLPKYEDLTLFVQNYSLGSSPLSNIVDFYRGSLISDTYYIDYDVARPAYIRGGDISSNRMVADNMVSISSDFIPSEETICIEGDIVMAMIGSVGTASIVTQDFSGSYISNNLGLLRIRNHSIRAEVLHLYLTSPIGRMFFTQRQMVTAQPKIAFRDIENIPIPLIRPEVQAEIAQHIQRSFALRKEASQLLEEAKLSVERAIRAGDMGGVIT